MHSGCSRGLTLGNGNGLANDMTSSSTDPRMPPRELSILRYALERQADLTPDKLFARFTDGIDWSFSDTLHKTKELGAALQSVGVKQGDLVLTFMPNDGDALRAWFAINFIGAVYVPLNTAYRGRTLEHALNLGEAQVLICHPGLFDRLEGVKASHLRHVIVAGNAPSVDLGDGIERHTLSELVARATTLHPLSRPIEPWDIQAVVHTSGTTGPSKGVMVSYAHLTTACNAFEQLTSDDRTMANLPLFHTGGIIAVYRMILKGGSVAVIESFSTTTFWDVIRSTGTTCLTLLGSMAPFLIKAEATPRDRDHSLRKVVMIPLTDDAPQFAERFGVKIYTAFNMTETSWPIFSEENPKVRGTCGKVRHGVEARVVDANDYEVPPNVDGELILRTDAPWSMIVGYLNDPAATARAWRNGWFHTGDIMRRDEDGNFFFVDRLKDAIRRRGENISSFELESEIAQHPSVHEVAAVGVPSEFGEDDVLVAIVTLADRSLEPEELIEYLRSRVPYYMIPRYVRLLSVLPKTSTQKVQKNVLRSDGITSDTWDREKSGIVVRRDIISSSKEAHA
jgi:carnitine-CoA ligase